MKKKILLLLVLFLTHMSFAQLYFVGESNSTNYPIKIISFDEDELIKINNDILPPQFTFLMTKSHYFKTIYTPTSTEELNGIEFDNGFLKLKTTNNDYFLNKKNCYFLRLEENLVVIKVNNEIIKLKK